MKIIYKNFAAKAAMLASDTQGSIVTIVAIALPVLVLAVGGAVDYNRINNAQAKLNAAVDAATQNVATMLEQLPDPEMEGNRFFKANFPAEYLGAKLLDSASGKGPLSVSHYKVKKELRVEGFAAADLPLTFASALGMQTYRIEHKAVVARVVKPNVEIILTADISPSMCALSVDSALAAGLDIKGGMLNGSGGLLPPTTGGGLKGGGIGGGSSGGPKLDPATLDAAVIAASRAAAAAAASLPPSDKLSPLQLIPDPNCTKLQALKLAMKKFVNHVFMNSAIDTIKIGIIPYNHKLRFANPNNIPPSIANAEVASPDYYTDLSDATPLPPIVPLTSDKDQLLAAIDAINLDLDAQGWTRTNLAAHAGALMLDPANTGYFGGLVPASYGDPQTEKIIVQMTDGANNGCCFGHIDGDTSRQYIYINKRDMDDQRALCPVLKKPVSEGGGGITMFSVIFDVRDTDYLDNDSQNISGIEREGGKWIKDVFKNCASNQQFYFDVPANGTPTGNVETEIEKAYFAIASYLYKLLIVY